MIITNAIYDFLISAPTVPPEVGGMLGKKGKYIDTVSVVPGESSGENVFFAPDALYMNFVLNQWQKERISFAGIYHTHAEQWQELSGADKEYIHTIMKAMPRNIDNLWFPLVFPGRTVRGYRAYRTAKEVYITIDDISII